MKRYNRLKKVTTTIAKTVAGSFDSGSDAVEGCKEGPPDEENRTEAFFVAISLFALNTLPSLVDGAQLIYVILVIAELISKHPSEVVQI